MSNTLAFNPLSFLFQKAEERAASGGQGQGAGSAPPIPSPAPAQAAPAAPAAPSGVPSTGQGDGGGFFGGLGTRLQSALNGDGLGVFGGPSAADNNVDPITGIPAGVTRRANNKSMMQMGLLLMAAGMPQSDESRSRLVAGAASSLDNSDTINNFSRNRLEMAKVKMLEQEQLRQTAARSMAMRALGFPADAIASVTGAPSAPGSGSTLGAMPSTSPEMAGGAVPAASGGNVPAPVERAPLAPVGDNAAPAPAQAAPAAPAVVPSTSLPRSAPPPPSNDVAFTDADRATFLMLPPDKQATFLPEAIQKRAEQEIQTAPYILDGVGVVTDVYKNGQKIKTDKIGDIGTNVIETVDPTSGAKMYRTVDDAGRVTDVKEIRDPVRDARAKSDYDNLNTAETMADPNNPGGVIPRPGSKREMELAEKNTKKENQNDAKVATAGRVTADLDRLEELLAGETLTNPVTGISGKVAGNIAGSAASDYDAVLQSVGSNIAFDRLQAMRDASPTGGALGAVSDTEIGLLKSSIAALDRNQSPPQILRNIGIVRQVYGDIQRKLDAYPPEAKAAGDNMAPAGAPKAGERSADEAASFSAAQSVIAKNPGARDEVIRRMKAAGYSVEGL